MILSKLLWEWEQRVENNLNKVSNAFNPPKRQGHTLVNITWSENKNFQQCDRPVCLYEPHTQKKGHRKETN